MATYKKLLKNRAGDTIIPVTERDTYTTTEQVVGTWINGKPVYRVVLSGNISSTTGTYVPTKTYNASTVDVISCTGKLVNDQNQYMQLGCYLNSSNYSGWFMSASAMTIFFPSAYNNGSYTIVIEYTKKTS